MLQLFAVVQPGLEPLLLAEIQALGIEGASSVPGGVELEGEMREVMRLNLNLRTATRVLVRAGTLHAAAFSELDRRARQIEWERFLIPGRPIAVRATSVRSRLYHTDGVAQRIAAAIAHRLKQPSELVKPSEDEAQQLIVATGRQNHWTISVDSSGELLHRRGYRLATAKAPVRETLAAALVMASGWDRASPLVDPFCGSGTIAIEAAMLARGIAPGMGRSFAFETWPGHDKAAWDALCVATHAAARSDAPVILGSDRDEGAIVAARANALRAGVEDSIVFSAQAFSALEFPPGQGAVVSNPPHGGRIGEGQDLRNLFAKLGTTLRERAPGWRVALLLGGIQHETLLKLSGATALKLEQGGAPVRLVTGRVAER